MMKAKHIEKNGMTNDFFAIRPGWRIERISNISKHCLGKMLDKAKNQGIPQPYLRNLNVRWFEFDLADLNQMPFRSEESDRYAVVKGDVVICEGGYPGRAAIWDSDEPIYFQKALHRVRFHNQLHAKWFVYYLYLQHHAGLLRQRFTGTGILHFTGEALARFELPIPPDNEIAMLLRVLDNAFEEIARARTLQLQKLDSLEALKQSLLHKAFSGNL